MRELLLILAQLSVITTMLKKYLECDAPYASRSCSQKTLIKFSVVNLLQLFCMLDQFDSVNKFVSVHVKDLALKSL
jgi:hypothetical protein